MAKIRKKIVENGFKYKYDVQFTFLASYRRDLSTED